MTNHSDVEKCLQNVKKNILGEDKSRNVLLWLETPSNPQCKVTDIATLCEISRKIIDPKQLCIAVDATWSTPYLLQPLQLGADVVMHSLTKYIGGHSDLLGGVLVTSKDTICSENITPLLRISHQVGGGVLGPWECYLATRGLRSLHVRMQRHCENALKLATFLSTHPQVEHVYYPGLVNHPQHELAKEQMNNRFGGMLSFLVKSKNNNEIEALKVSTNVYF